ncbi:WYL domain-containing protein [Faecalibacillus intestinalis]|uniref:WYL domain-containing protein n=1 Tax=Faecalibacillus intestinalis TaxID=1982626 RepID=A0AAP2XPK7_9FIRM|nr:WYL domain-containing protein [Faecalibacillus intestinalis]MCB8593654.1 WYL domain-containing protein [Faecalibacillus intestinalis]MCB8614620.1 WYL domain-containing protein [Faecalibacillus intestinalis]MCG4681532.1 WYL domain-containing protein [Faecalibacillus intestinalis]MCG4715141.1 WYL domain-containing protein [Faecalibacillus intestinalis]MCG4756356.1 WYL domain-containing protein [Faecalibacillus intestinalis]
MDRLYYTYLIIKESLDYIPAIEIKMLLEEKYQIKVDIKTVYQAIRNVNELSHYIYQKDIIKTKHRKGYAINEEFFNDGQMQYLWDSILYNNDLDQKEVNILLTKLQTLSSNKQLSRIQNQTIRQNDIRNYDLLLNMTTIIKAINEKKNIYFKYVNYEIKRNRLVEISNIHGNHQDNKEFYIISPYKLIQNNSKYYVIGYFDKRPDSLSLYRLDRMRLVRNHKSKYFEGEQFDVEQIDNPINMYISGEKEDLEISFDQSIIKEVVDKFGQDNRVTKDYENRYHLIVKDVLINEGLIGWLMMLQDKITVIKPYSLKENMKERIEKTLKQYQ